MLQLILAETTEITEMFRIKHSTLSKNIAFFIHYFLLQSNNTLSIGSLFCYWIYIKKRWNVVAFYTIYRFINLSTLNMYTDARRRFLFHCYMVSIVRSGIRAYIAPCSWCIFYDARGSKKLALIRSVDKHWYINHHGLEARQTQD